LKNNKIRIFFFTWLVFLLAFSCSSAFFPDIPEVSKNMEDRYASIDSLKADISLRDNSTLRIRIWRKDNKWRQEWISKKGNSSELVQAAIGRERRLLASFPEKSSFPLSLLHFWYPGHPSKFWQNLGINKEKKSYQFLGKNPCLVIGAEYKEMDRPQLWLHKEKYFPLQVINWEKIKWRWKEYAAVGNYFLPHVLQIYFPEGKNIKMDIAWKGINSGIPERLFDVQKFREKYSGAVSSIKNSEYKKFDYLHQEIPQAFK